MDQLSDISYGVGGGGESWEENKNLGGIRHEASSHQDSLFNVKYVHLHFLLSGINCFVGWIVTGKYLIC